MMPNDMSQDDGAQAPHDDEEQDKNMIISILQKVIDEMKGMESDRLMPDHMKPPMPDASAAPVNGMSMGGGIPHPNEDSAESLYEAEPENQDNQHEPLDPDILKKLMDTAEGADEDGSTKEDELNELDSELADAVRRKRMK